MGEPEWQVEALALRTWTSEEALLLEKERRRAERVRKADAKRKKASEGGSFDDSAPKRGKAKVAGDTSEVLARLAPPFHEHQYVREEYNDDSDLWTRYCECGFSETFERM